MLDLASIPKTKENIYHYLLVKMTALPPLIKHKLHGKVAIVTGGATGIGEVTVHHFISYGARAVVIGDVQDHKGRNVAASIGSDRCSYMHCDVTDENQVEHLVKATVSKYGRLDVMFSNAGILPRSMQTVVDLDLSVLDRTVVVNTKGAAACVKHAARAMKEGGVKGSIICTASTAATMGMETFTDYVMSKHAVLGLMRSASMQLAEYGIRVNSVSPGSVATPMTCEGFGVDKEVVEEVVQHSSRLKGLLKEKHLAEAASFLASDESEFVTGVNLVVDGGFLMPKL